MRKLFVAVTAAILAGCGGMQQGVPEGTIFSEDGLSSLMPACPGPSATGDARCHAWAKAGPMGQPTPNATTPSGKTPAQIQAAYGLSPTAGAGRTVAIVDAYDWKTAENDLAYYRSYFGLPACTTANGCFKKVNQNGVQGSYPRANAGWAMEMALDVDAVSSACPACKIILVEASSNSFANLSAAVNTAANMGANAISNSYGGGESSGQDESAYNHPGIAVTVSSGDSGYGVEFPASSRYVTAVGGTTLGSTETVWSGSGSGCSAYVPKPTWQTDTGCARRTVADVSADADPNTGLAIYDTTAYNGMSGWIQVGGTSLSSPLIAAIYAAAGNSVTSGSYPYSHTSALHDVTSGSNGSCGGSYLCTGVAGYEGPTGLGTPKGYGAF